MPNFKELYKADNLLLSPEPELLELLSARMREEANIIKTENKKTPLFRKIPVYKTAATAAALIILVAGVMLLPFVMNGGQFVNVGLSENNKADLIAGAETFPAAAGEAEYFGADGFYEKTGDAADILTDIVTDIVTESTYIFIETEAGLADEADVYGEEETEQENTGSDSYAGEIMAGSGNNSSINPFGRTAGAENPPATTAAATQATAVAETSPAATTTAKITTKTVPAEITSESASQPEIENKTTSVPDEKSSQEKGSIKPSYDLGNDYKQAAGYENWPIKEYWKSYVVSNKTPEFITRVNNTVKNESEEEYEQDSEEDAVEDNITESGTGGGSGKGIKTEEDENEDTVAVEAETEEEYEENAETPLFENSLPSIPYFNVFEDFTKFFMSSPHGAVRVNYSTGAGFNTQKDLKGKNTLPFYSMLTSCLDKKMSLGAAGGYYVCFTVKSDKREIYFKINYNDVMKISVSDYSGNYIFMADNGTFSRLWNLADSY